MSSTDIRLRSWIKGTDADARSGLLGFLSVCYHDLVLDGIVLRRTADGRYALSFPARSDRAGKKHSYIRPASDEIRREIERELLRQLGQREDLGVATEDRP